MDWILTLLREAAPEMLGGLIVVALSAIASAIASVIIAAIRVVRKKRPRINLMVLICIAPTVIFCVVMGVAVFIQYYQFYRDTPTFAENVIVLVAEFDGSDPQGYYITDYLGAHLDEELAKYGDDNIELRALERPISAVEGNQVARAEGEKQKAFLVVRGWYSTGNTAFLHLHLETIPHMRFRFPPVLVTDIDGQVVNMSISELEDLTLQNQLALEMTDLITGLALFAAHNWEESIKYWTSASTRLEDGLLVLDDPSVIYFYRASAHYYNEKYEQAISDFNMAIDLNPSNALAYLGRGFAYYEIGYYRQTISDITVAIDLDPNIEGAYYGRALAYANIDEFDLAVEDHEKALDELPWSLAILYVYTSNDPDIAKAYYQNGLTCVSNQDLETAAKRFRRATLINPDMAEAYCALGSVYVQLDDEQEAKSAFKTCLEKSDDPDLQRQAEEQLRALRSPFR